MKQEVKTRRDLLPEEKALYEKGLAGVRGEKRKLEYQLKSNCLLLNKGIDWKYEKLKDELLSSLKKLKEENKSGYEVESVELYLEGLEFQQMDDVMGVRASNRKIEQELQMCKVREDDCVDKLINGVEIKKKVQVKKKWKINKRR
jgi:hypothetical protein